MKHFSAWIIWHGPYGSTSKWIEAANAHARDDAVDNFRLYLALGRSNAFSINSPTIQYVGLNSKDSEQTLAQEISNKINGAEKRFNGIFNEYWIGELRTQFAERDTPASGLTKDAERSIIYALDPKQNLNGYMQPPEFSFRLLNEIAESAKKQQRFLTTRFESLIPNYLEYDASTGWVSRGRVKIVRKKHFHARNVKRLALEAKRVAVLYWWERIARGIQQKPFG